MLLLLLLLLLLFLKQPNPSYLLLHPLTHTPCIRRSRLYAKHQLPLPLFSLVFQSPAIAHPSMPLDEEELECILAVLIHRRFVKGYISHKPLVLVCAKEREKAFPFPWPRE